MKHTFDIKSMVLGVTLGAIIMFSVAAATSRGITTWDYKIISGRLGKSAHPPLAEQLDQAAAGGWDVVCTASDDGYPFVILRKTR
jgi:hypothetical protein